MIYVTMTCDVWFLVRVIPLTSKISMTDSRLELLKGHMDKFINDKNKYFVNLSLNKKTKYLCL